MYDKVYIMPPPVSGKSAAIKMLDLMMTQKITFLPTNKNILNQLDKINNIKPIKGGKQMETETKFVEFEKYCPLCKNSKLAESEDPCNECLTSPANIESHKPVNFEEA